MWFLGQVFGQISEVPLQDASHIWMIMIFEIIAWLLTVPYFFFWLWMLVHCYRTEPDRNFWLWVMFIVQPIGAIAYFVLRYLPSKEFPTPAFLRKWTRGRELARLEVAARQIGNPYQFVQWGDVLREVGLLDQANDAYTKAIAKESQNIQALWGMAQVAVAQQRYADVQTLTRKILDQDPQYKFGDVSLAYGRALKELGDVTAARSHLEQHVKRWRHPEAIYLLAELCAAQNDREKAREYLSGLIMDLNGSPAAIARKFGRWKSRAKLMLRRLKD